MSIWRFSELKNDFNESDKLLTLDEGDTPTTEVKFRGLNLFIKREDLNPTGSWKDRSTAYKLSKLIKNGINGAVIASSGNAAISYMQYANLIQGFVIHVVVSPNISEEKINILKDNLKGRHKIYFESQAKTFATKLALELGLPLLKSGIDDEMISGYRSLGFEIYEEHKKRFNDMSVLISPASSGAGVQGLVDGLFYKLGNEFKMPRVIVTQTEECAPLVEMEQNPPPPSFEKGRGFSGKVSVEDRSSDAKRLEVQDDNRLQKSLAEAIVDKSMLRKYKIRLIMNNTNGQPFAITNQELIKAKGFVNEIDPKNSRKLQDLSYTSLLSIASFLRIYENKLYPEIKTYFLIASGR